MSACKSQGRDDSVLEAENEVATVVISDRASEGCGDAH